MRREKMLKADMQNDGQGVSYKKKKIAYFLRNIYMFST